MGQAVELSDRVAMLASAFCCAEEEAAPLDRLFAARRYDDREIVIQQEDEAQHVWLVVDGSAHSQALNVDGQYTRITSYEPGEMFGSYPQPAASRSEIVASGGLTAFRVETEALVGVARKMPGIAMGLTLLLAAQLNAILDRLAARVTMSAVGRVHAEILRLAGDERMIAPPPVIAGIAIRAQTTRETASRAINALERRGIIRRDAQSLEILAPRALAELAI
ncbi:MAG: Crp/Fnr family transcriptional regulator [Parasphingopyxis sp.]|nr:Crp/Fnr family transcriptional regulator [Sphingomonadales bacterium]